MDQFLRGYYFGGNSANSANSQNQINMKSWNSPVCESRCTCKFIFQRNFPPKLGLYKKCPKKWKLFSYSETLHKKCHQFAKTNLLTIPKISNSWKQIHEKCPKSNFLKINSCKNKFNRKSIHAKTNPKIIMTCIPSLDIGSLC